MVAAGWAFTPRCYLEAALLADARMPAAEDLFYQPLYNNRTIDDPVPERTSAAELGWRLTGPVLDLQVTAFAVLTLDGTETPAATTAWATEPSRTTGMNPQYPRFTVRCTNP